MDLHNELRPKERFRVIDLVRDAGVDVDDWVNFRKGRNPARAASNPKYCYNWAFLEPGKVAVLNLWYKNLAFNGDQVSQTLNYRKIADKVKAKRNKSAWLKRARAVDQTIVSALDQRLPIYVIICTGDMRNLDDKASSVKARLLDRTPWTITHFNVESGDYTLTRGISSDRFADQFSQPEHSGDVTERYQVNGQAYKRSRNISMLALRRAGGCCEWCREPGFILPNGKIFLETHHIIPLSEGGRDHPDNVAALCPNHHREAHLGQRADAIRETLLRLRNSRLTPLSKPPYNSTGRQTGAG